MTKIPKALSEDLFASAEMNHRIANNLALLAAMLEIDGRMVSDPIAAGVVRTAQQRVLAIACVHRRLYLSGQTEMVHIGEFLDDLGDALRGLIEGTARHRTLDICSDGVDLPADHAAALGMLVAELVGNACKHAYPHDAPGEIRIAFKGGNSGGWELSVEDDGIGFAKPLEKPSANEGLGTRIIDAVARRLGARHRWEDRVPGTRFLIWISSPQDVRASHGELSE